MTIARPAIESVAYQCGGAAGADLDAFCGLIWAAQAQTEAAVRSPAKIRACVQSVVTEDFRYSAAYVSGALIGVQIGCDYDALFPRDPGLPERLFYLSDVAVHPDYRRQGVASTLVRALVRDLLPSYRWFFTHSAIGTVCCRAFLARGWTTRSVDAGKLGLLKCFDESPQF